MRTSKCQRFIPSFSFISCHFYIPYDSFHQLALAKDVHYECHFSSFNLKYYQKSPFNHTISKKIIVKKIDLIFLQYNRSLKEQKSVQITWSNYLTTSKKLVILGKKSLIFVFMSTKQDCDMNKNKSAHDTIPLMTQIKFFVVLSDFHSTKAGCDMIPLYINT